MWSASSFRSLDSSQRGDLEVKVSKFREISGNMRQTYSGIHQMKVSWITEKTPWMSVGTLQDQELGMCCVPKANQPQIRAPRFHKQLYTVVILARCCGCAISVISIGQES